MNCRKGDVAMVVRVTDPKNRWMLGQVVRCAYLEVRCGRAGWRLEEGITHAETEFEWLWIADDCLRPLRDSDGVDEMIRISGLPSGVAA